MDDFDDTRSVTSEISQLSQAFSTAFEREAATAESVYGLDPDEENGEPEVEAEHACSYCGFSDPASVVLCVESSKWFCNGKGGTTSSHIVHHLVRSKNKKAKLHEDSPLGDSELECYNCGTKNVFLLGFISAAADSVVVILCREPCLANGALKDMGWDLSQWMPLIEDRSFLSWLVRTPSEKEQLRTRQITTAQINKLEELWRENPNASLFDLDRPGPEDEYVSIMPDMRYEDGYNYQNIVAPLVLLEANEDKRLKEEQRQEDLTVSWESSLGRNKIAVFSFPGIDDMRVVPGDEIILRLDAHGTRLHGEKWEGRGTVQRIIDGNIEMSMKSPIIPGKKEPITDGYSAEFVWKNAVYDRMHRALKAFALDDTAVSGYLYHRILGHEVEPQVNKVNIPASLSAPGLPELNDSQIKAVREVLHRNLSLIQGPPGTGKTTTSASIVYHIVQQNQGQMLVCSPSNVAVDHLTEKIHRCGLRVVRLCALTRETLPSSVEHLSLHSMVRNLDTPQWSELRKYLLLKESMGELKANDAKKLRDLVSKAEKEILEAADVICCTCVGAGDPRLANFRFRHVLIDESTHATEAECLIPITMGVKNLVLVGDHRQLGPVVMSKAANKHGLGLTLFERLVNLGTRPLRLEVQYRMHPALSEWPSDMFYDGALQNAVTDVQRNTSHLNLPWPHPDRPMFFLNSDGAEEISSNGSSYLNRREADELEKVVSLFVSKGVDPEQIGVITAYEGQRAHVANLFARGMHSNLAASIEVASVDAFQGREKQFILISCVRSNEQQGIGFLKDPRRLNVALTRASHGLVVVGNVKLLARDSLWNNLITFFQARDCLSQGSIKDLIPYQQPIPRARGQGPDREFMRDRSSGGGGGGGGGGGDYSRDGDGWGNPFRSQWGEHGTRDGPLDYEHALLAPSGRDLRNHPRYTPSEDSSYRTQSSAAMSASQGRSSATRGPPVLGEASSNYILHFDGSCNNGGDPNARGYAGWGFVIYDVTRKVKEIVNDYGPIVDNGQPKSDATISLADYTALVKGLQGAYKMGISKLHVRGDSDIVRQLLGEVGVSEHLTILHAEVKKTAASFEGVVFELIDSQNNVLADELAKKGRQIADVSLTKPRGGRGARGQERGFSDTASIASQDLGSISTMASTIR